MTVTHAQGNLISRALWPTAKTSSSSRSETRFHLPPKPAVHTCKGVPAIPPSIEELEVAIERFTADGAHDTRAIYKALTAAGEREVTIVIPPRKTASPSEPVDESLEQRDAATRRIAEVGRRQRRKESGVHQQARGEDAMFRYKRLIGDGLRGGAVGAWRLAVGVQRSS